MGVTSASLSIPAADRLDEAPTSGRGERALIDQARHDPEAFGALYRAHYRAVAGMLYRRTGDEHAAEDLAAQTFINAYRSMGRYRHTGAPFRAWLMRIAIHEAHRWARRSRRRREVETGATPNGRTPRDESAGEEVRAAIRALSQGRQDVLTLVYFESMTVAGAAQVLGVPEGTVKSRLARAREALKAELGRRETTR